MQASSRNAARL